MTSGLWFAPGVALLAASSACSDDEVPPRALPAPIWHGEHIRFRTDSPEPLCGGTLSYMDSAVPLFADALEVPAPPLIDFYWHPSPLKGSPCLADAAGCWDGEMIWSRIVPHDHEIVHAVTHSLGSSDRMVEEGTAVVYGDDGGLVEWYEEATHDAETLIALDDASVGPDVYTSAAHLVRFLLERHDMESFHVFWRSTPRAATRDEVATSFASAFGESWEEFSAVYATHPSCIRGAIRMKLIECLAPTLPWEGTSWQTELELTCEAIDIVGPTQGLMWKTVTVDVAVPGRYSLEVVGTGDAMVTLARCDVGCDGAFAENLYSGQQRTRELPAGRYYAKFWRWVHEPGPLELRIVPQL